MPQQIIDPWSTAPEFGTKEHPANSGFVDPWADLPGQEATEPRELGEVATDAGASLMSGFASLGGAASQVGRVTSNVLSQPAQFVAKGSDALGISDDAEGAIERGVSAPFDAADKSIQRAQEFWAGAQSEQMQHAKGEIHSADGVVETARAAWENPMAIGDLLISSSVQMLVPGAAARGTGLKATRLALAKGASKEAAKRAGRKAGGKAGAAVGGISEGALAGNEARQEVLRKTPEELIADSQAYLNLRQQDVSHKEAVATLADRAGLTAQAISTPLSILMSKVTGAAEVEAGFFTGQGVKDFLKALGKEVVEETGQEGSQNFAVNTAVKTTADDDRGLTEGLGRDATLGAIAGGGQAGGMRLTTAAVQAPGALRDRLKSTPDEADQKSRAETAEAGGDPLEQALAGARAATEASAAQPAEGQPIRPDGPFTFSGRSSEELANLNAQLNEAQVSNGEAPQQEPQNIEAPVEQSQAPIERPEQPEVTQEAVETEPAPTPEIVEHTTRKGKVLRGIIRDDLDKEQAKAIDPFTMRKNGGWFIREKHLGKPGALPSPIDAAAHEAATSPTNDRPEPTEGLVTSEQILAEAAKESKSFDALQSYANGRFGREAGRQMAQDGTLQKAWDSVKQPDSEVDNATNQQEPVVPSGRVDEAGQKARSGAQAEAEPIGDAGARGDAGQDEVDSPTRDANPKPWAMARAEWDRERERIRPNTAQSRLTKASGSQSISGINRLLELTDGVTDAAQQRLERAQKGEVELSQNELESLMDRINTPASHRDVVEKALKEGRPVPESVLDEYPDLKAPKSTPKAEELSKKDLDRHITTNTDTNPTEAQKEAGNYKKASINVQGLDISIENPRGSKRSGTDPDGSAWEVTMKSDYGYIRGTEGADADHVDVFVGDNMESKRVFVIDQTDRDGNFDEHKVMLGFKNKLQAIAGYKKNYKKGWKVGPVTQMSMDEFNAWLKSGKTKKPLNDELRAKGSKPDQETVREKKAQPKSRKPKQPLRQKRMQEYLGVKVGDAITPSKDSGYLEGGRQYVVESIRPDGGVELRTETGINMMSFSEMNAAKRQGVVFSKTEAESGNREQQAPKLEKPIEDFGEVISGARKDLATKMREAAKKDIASVPLSESWPEPNYQKLLTDGVDSKVVALFRAARDEVPTKPKTAWKLVGWEKKVESLRGMAQQMLDGEIPADQFSDKAYESPLLAPFIGRAELYEAVGHYKSLKGVKLSAASYSLFEGKVQEPPKVVWAVERAAKATAFGNMPQRIASGDTKQEAINGFKKAYGSMTEEKTSKQTRFDIYSSRSDRTDVFIGKKIGSDVARIKDGFKSFTEARAYLSDNQSELETILAKMKEVPNHRKEINSPRVGIDHRKGGNVTPEQFTEAFGFRGVQFGNYVEQGRRQEDLNEAYDGLMDLAGILNVPPKALSLNGELGLAFGARGKGGKRAPKAHYESDQIVINLTKNNGAGSLAHEWFHGLDNYFQRSRGVEGRSYTSENARLQKVLTADNKMVDETGIRPEVVEAFQGVVSAIAGTRLRQRSSNLDRSRTKPYWATGREMFARAFESYVIEKLRDQEGSNDYLANIVSPEYWAASAKLNEMIGVAGEEKADSYPYPEAAEVPAIRAAFDNLFETIETKQTDSGVALFSLSDNPARVAQSSPDGSSITQAQADKVIRRITAGIRDKSVRIQAVADFTGFPKAVQDYAKNQGHNGNKVEGVYHDGSIYVSASALQDEAGVERVVLHELMGHHGIRKLFGASTRQAMTRLYMAVGGSKGINALAKKHNINLSHYARGMAGDRASGNLSREDYQSVMMDELLAHIAQDNKPSVKRFLKELIGQFRAWLREKGFAALAKFNDADLMHILRQAREAVISDTDSQGRDIRLMVNDDEQRQADNVLDLPLMEVEEVPNEPEAGANQRRGEDAKPDRARTVGGGKARPGWAGATSIRGEAGRPSTVYRGQRGPLKGQDFEQLGASTGHPSAHLGVWFTLDRAEASQYGPQIGEYHLDIRNPRVYKTDSVPNLDGPTEASKLRARLQKQGHDGIVIDYRDVGGVAHVVAFNPEQVIEPDDIRMSVSSDPEVRSVDEGATEDRSGTETPVTGSPSDSEPQPSAGVSGFGVPQTETAEFKRWFGDSKVVDEQGEPLVVYHGSAGEFTRFDPEKRGSVFSDKASKQGFFFVDDKEGAKFFARKAGGNNVIESFLRMESPYIVDNEVLSEAEKEWLNDLEESDPDEYEFQIETKQYQNSSDINPGLERAILDGIDSPGKDGVIVQLDDDFNEKWYIVKSPTQIKSATGNTGAFDPENPDIRFSLTEADQDLNALDDAGLPEALHKRDTGKVRKIARNFKSKHWGKFLGAIPRRYLVDFAERGMTSVKSYVRLAQQMEADRNQLLSQSADIADKWTKWASKHKKEAGELASLMHEATIASVDPSKPHNVLITPKEVAERTKVLKEQARGRSGEGTSPQMKKIADLKRKLAQERNRQKARPEIVAKWEALSPEAQELFKEVRDHYGKRREEILRALSDRINRAEADENQKARLQDLLRTQFESQSVEGPYFPLSRFGDYWGLAKNDEGEVVSFAMFESLSKQEDWIAEMDREGHQTDKGRKAGMRSAMKQVDPAFASKVTSMVADVHGPTAEALADDIWQLYLQTLPEMSARKHFIHRKKTAGYSEDAIRSFAKSTFHTGHHIAKLRFSDVMESELDQLEEQARNADREDLAMPLYEEMVSRHEWAMNPTQSALAQNLTSFGFAWYLGATPAAALVNLTQTPIVGLPVLSAKHGWRRSASALAKASKDLLGKQGMEGNLKGDELTAHQEFVRAGVLDKTQAHDLAGVAEQGGEYSPRKQKVMSAVAFMFHKAEQYNREVMAMAAYRLGRDKGLSHDQAVLQAEDAVWDAHFDYSNANRPRYMQNNLAKVALLFKQHSLNMTYRLWRDFHESFRGATPELKKEARTRFAGILGMTSIFAGASGMPLLWAVEMIANAIGGDEDEPYDFMTDVRVGLSDAFGPKVAEAVMHGPVDALSGLSISGRVSLNNLWMREPYKKLEGAELWSHYLGEWAGPVANIGEGWFEGARRIKEGHVGRGIEGMLPKAARDVLKALRYADEGALNYRGDSLIDRDNVGAWTSVAQLIGFTPAELNMRYEQNNAIKSAEQKILRRRSFLMNKYALALRFNDYDAKEEAWEAIKKFNRANPEVRITRRTLIRSRRVRERYSRESQNGVNVNKNLRHLSDELNFTE